MYSRIAFGYVALLAAPAAVLLAGAGGQTPDAPASTEPRFIDLSLVVAPEYPCTWPTFPPFQLNPYRRIGPAGAYNSDIIVMDGNTGTQLDVPAHSVTPPASGWPNAGPFGLVTTDKVPPWQFAGEACVIDCTALLDTTPNGRSDLVKKERVIAWEKKHRPLGPGDVVVFRSGYSDKYYRPLPEGRRFAADPVAGKAPAWPDPDPECMEYLASRKVRTLATDSVSMGPLPDLAEPTHFAGLKHGMIWTESGTGFAALPATGAFYCMLGPKHIGDPYSEARAFAIVGAPLAGRLIESVRQKRVIDLSVGLGDDLPATWPGRGVGNHRQPYVTIRFGLNPNTRAAFPMHMFDSSAGTHLVPPAYVLPPAGFENTRYAPQVRAWLAEYEAKYGPRGTSDVTADRVPVAQTCGPARVIDVRYLLGSTRPQSWPASPEIGVAELRTEEQRHGPFKGGEVVLFRSGWSDQYYKPLPAGAACMDEPLNGKREGWPAPGPEAIAYLAAKGVRCVGTDAPTLGGVEEKQALMSYWLLASRGMVGVEFLTNLGGLPERAYFVFAAIKIKDCHGGPGRAIALY